MFIHNRSGITINDYFFETDDWINLHPNYELPENCVGQIYTPEYRIGYTTNNTEIILDHPWIEGDLYIRQAYDDYTDINELKNWKRWAWNLMNDSDMDSFLATAPHHKVSFLIALIQQPNPDPLPIQALWNQLKGSLTISQTIIDKWDNISTANRIPISF